MASQKTDSADEYLFFSIVIPAHNEAKLIGSVLSHLKKMDYPKNRFEVILVENGSSDKTYEIAKKYESDNFKILTSSEKGVSKARNRGIEKCSPELDWALIMDADTFLEKGFLLQLNAYLNLHTDVDFGTTSIQLDDHTLTGKFWSGFTNFFDRLFKIMHRVHIVRKDLLAKEKYDEELIVTEDLKYSRDLAKHGKYFFMKTDKVINSARRFRHKGYVKMFFINLYHGILPRKINKKHSWKVIR